jgi:hypothetical protein
MIRVYCVGIHFRHHIDFVPDLQPAGEPPYMTGAAILAACATKWKLRYKLTTKPPSAVDGHINYVSYTPDSATDNEKADPGSSPRVTFAIFGSKVFPFFGQPLSLAETLAPIGQPSQVLQYGVQSINGGAIPKLYFKDPPPPPPPPLPPPPNPDFIRPGNDGQSSFGKIGIPDNSEVRIRLLSIYCTY